MRLEARGCQGAARPRNNCSAIELSEIFDKKKKKKKNRQGCGETAAVVTARRDGCGFDAVQWGYDMLQNMAPKFNSHDPELVSNRPTLSKS